MYICVGAKEKILKKLEETGCIYVFCRARMCVVLNCGDIIIFKYMICTLAKEEKKKMDNE